MTKVYLALPARDATLLQSTFGESFEDEVNFLITAPNAKFFFQNIASGLRYDSWCMDSGAFEAFTQGRPLSYEVWRDAILASPGAHEVFGLDVIGDAEASRKNVERAWRDGIPAMPTFHCGSDFKHLEWMAKAAPKIALGGVARMSIRKRAVWFEECFRRTWPCRVHGFGVTDYESIKRIPFHSVDSSTWFYAPKRFMFFRQYSHGFATGVQRRVPCKGFNDLRGEVIATMRYARFARWRWSKEMNLLEGLPCAWPI